MKTGSNPQFDDYLIILSSSIQRVMIYNAILPQEVRAMERDVWLKQMRDKAEAANLANRGKPMPFSLMNSKLLIRRDRHANKYARIFMVFS